MTVTVSVLLVASSSWALTATNVPTIKRVGLLFDCDGVLVETEELHRLAYNAAFAKFDVRIGGVRVDWSVEYYDKLQNTVGGGKPKMRWHFTQNGQPDSAEDVDALIDDLQDYKTQRYKELVETAEARPGILDLLDSAIDEPRLAVGICSASTREGFEKVVDCLVGPERLSRLDIILAGDDVKRKKPDPEIYTLAATRLGIDPANCVVIEDSLVGLKAAKAAQMRCVITYTASTHAVDFYEEGADAKLPDFGRSDATLESLFAPDFARPQHDILATTKD